MKTKTKKAVKGKPAFGSPEFRAKYAGKKGKRKTPSWKKQLTSMVKIQGKLITRLAKAQGIKVPTAAKRAKRIVRRKARR